MNLPLCLTRLEKLEVCLDPLAIPDVVDTSHLSGVSLEQSRAIWLSRPFSLKIRFDHWEDPETAKLDICAKYVRVTDSSTLF